MLPELKQVIEILMSYPSTNLKGLIYAPTGELWLPGPPPTEVSETDLDLLDKLSCVYLHNTNMWAYFPAGSYPDNETEQKPSRAFIQEDGSIQTDETSPTV